MPPVIGDHHLRSGGAGDCRQADRAVDPRAMWCRDDQDIWPGGGTASLTSLAGVAGALEVLGGALLLVGWFTRPVAFLLSGEMAVAYFIGHAPQGFWPVLNGGGPAVSFCFLWLYLSAAGPGPWSIDALRRRKAGAV